MKGRAVRLVTTQRTYLSISGFEAYTGSAGSSTTTTSSSSSSTSYRVSGNSSVITISKAYLNKPYSTGSYKAEWALQGGSKTAIAAKGVGNFWKGTFSSPALVEKVKVKNRHDCCGNRIAGTKITIGGQFCGTITGGSNGQWIEVKCEKPLYGTDVQLTTTRNDYL
jgi:hypothetical protein